MNSLLSEFGKRIAEKWLTLAVLPGLLYLGATTVAVMLQHRHALELARLARRAVDLAVTFDRGGPTVAVLIVAGMLLAGTAAGLAAQALATLIQRAWLGTWGWFAPLGAKLVERRQRRWDVVTSDIDAAVRAGYPPERGEALVAARSRIAHARPRLPSRIGDRLSAADARVYAEYELDLIAAWPHLWLVVPDNVRDELRSAGARFSGAALLAAWGVLYAIIGLVWWPAVLIGAVTLFAAWRRARDAADAYACLLEAAVDLYGIELARSLGLADEHDRFTVDLGKAITDVVRKGG